MPTSLRPSIFFYLISYASRYERVLGPVWFINRYLCDCQLEVISALSCLWSQYHDFRNRTNKLKTIVTFSQMMFLPGINWAVVVKVGLAGCPGKLRASPGHQLALRGRPAARAATLGQGRVLTHACWGKVHPGSGILSGKIIHVKIFDHN